MWITKLELRNIKSHVDSGVIPFTRGVNAISGPNGAGKSTLLEAIGFALFDSLPYTQSQFLREGEKSGEVVVSFIDVLDEREYQVVRTVGTSSIYIFDPEINVKVVTGKADVVAWLKEHLGVDNSADLTALFEDSIGVPQGLLSAAFLERPAERKAKFDPLLQVDEYEDAWTRLRDVVRVVSEGSQELHRKIAELTGELKQLPTLEEELSKLQKQSESRKENLERLDANLKQLEREQSALDEEQKRLQKLQGEVEANQARLHTLEVQMKDAQASVSEAEQASQQVEASRQAHQSYLNAEEQLEQLEQQRSERDQLNTRKNALDKDLALIHERLENVTSSLVEMQTIEHQLEELKPQIGEQEQLTEQFAQAQRFVAKLEAQRSLLAERERKLASLTVKLSDMRSGVDKRSSLQEERAADRQALQSFERDVARLNAERASLKSELEKIKRHRSALDESHEAGCPVCHQPLDAAHREQLLDNYLDQVARLHRQLEEFEDQIKDARGALEAKRTELQRLENELESLPDQKRLDALESEHQHLTEQASEQREQIAELARAEEELDEYQTKLDDLGDPKGRWSLLNAQLEEREDLAGRKRDLQSKLQNLNAELTGVDDQLAAFKSLQDQISKYQQHRQENQPGYRSYIANISVAEQLQERQARLEGISSELLSTQTELEEQQAALERANQAFDEERYKQVRVEMVNTSKELARLEAIIEESEKRLEQLKKDLSDLTAKKELLADSEQDLAHRQAAAEALDFIRSAIRNAGPFVTRALVQTISLEANRVFGEIINDHSLRLLWNDDYSISIEQTGELREFSQLSGGEKTAAALSVRLALLRELSRIRVAFFDEPTSNLDDQRRDNLASQITQITGFNQLFVISHDDTFERETHHVVHVRKSHGASQVEVG